MPSHLFQLEEIVRDVSGVEGEIDPTWDLVAQRVIKSVMLLEIIATIEEEFEVDVTAQDVYEGHFASLRAMDAFLKRVQSRGGS